MRGCMEGVVLLLVGALVLVLVYKQFRGEFTPKTELTMVASRAGLVMEAGSKVTYNGVEIGQGGQHFRGERDGRPAAKLVLDVNPRYIGRSGQCGGQISRPKPPVRPSYVACRAEKFLNNVPLT